MPDEEEREPTEVIDKIVFVPAELISRLYTCADCGDQYISPGALAIHHTKDHA